MNDTLAPEKSVANQNSARLQLILSLAFNAIPLAGVTFWGWSAFELIFLYWLENVVIGARTALMMLLSARFNGVIATLGTTAFFTAHYGIFCLVHGMFVMSLFGDASGSHPFEFAPTGSAITIGLWAMIAWQAALLLLHVISGDRSNAMDMMGSPYPRIIVLHLTILGGGFLLMALDWPHAGVVLLAILKTLMDAGIAFTGGKVLSTDRNKTSRAASSPPSRSHP